MNVILDTCALIWCVSAPDKLSAGARKALVERNAGVYVSAISCAEIACLVASGKIDIKPHWRTWFDRAILENGWSVLDIDLETVKEAFSLPGEFHRDPADRFIVAAARLHRLNVITGDRRILDYPYVQSLW